MLDIIFGMIMLVFAGLPMLPIVMVVKLTFPGSEYLSNISLALDLKTLSRTF